MQSIPQSGTRAIGDAGLPSIAEKVRFLSAPGAYPHAPASVAVLETHMSYVFLAGDKVYKLKKPVRYPFLDFSTIDAREHNCREEVRLNRRLAADVYLGVAPLTYSAEGGMALGGEGAVVDWLVEMRRLPRDAMLDRLIAEDRLSAAQIDALCDTLAAFYRGVERSLISAEDYALRFFREQEKNRDVLTRRDFALDHGRTPVLLDLLDARLAASRSELQERVFQGQVVDGHGDLRPEHICFRDPIAIFDCLEFNAELRQVDPFDELAYLGVECALLGANTLGVTLVDKVAQRLSCEPPRRLVSLYAAWRAVLRARQSVAHLLDESPREPTKWEPLATRYLNVAQSALAADAPTGR
jgi:aminoglycoside phosphotransferase family enzyme